MSLEQLLNVEEKLVERAVEEVRQFAAEHSVVQQPQQQRNRMFGIFPFAQPKPTQITQDSQLYWAKEIYDWMQANFAEEVVFGYHPNLALESRGVDYLTSLLKGTPRYEGIDLPERYKASGLGQAAIYAILAERLGLEARVVFDDIELPALGFVSSMDEPVRKATGRLYSVAITAADNEGRAREVRILPYYKNGFGIDLTGWVVLDNNPLLTVAPKRAFEPSEKAITALIRAGQASFLDIEEASRQYEEALKELGAQGEAECDIKTLYDYAEALRGAGMHSAGLSEKATQLFQQVLELDTSHDGAKNSIKYAREAAAKANAELEHQKLLVANNPEDVRAALLLYFLLRREGLNEGFEAAEQVLKSKGTTSQSDDWRELSDDYYKLKGDVGKALELLQEGVKQFPNDWVLRYNLGNFLFATGRWEEAAQQLEHGIAGHFAHTKNNYFGVANAVQGNLSEAIRLFRLGVQENEYHSDIRRNLAVVQFWQGTPESLEAAKKELIDNLVRGKSDILSLLYLGAIYQKQGMRKLAFDYYMQALEKNPNLEVAGLLLKSVSNGLTLEEALEPLKLKMTGFRPNMQPEEKRYKRADFGQVFLLDAAGRPDEALEELVRLEEKAKLDGMVNASPTEFRRYREILQLREQASENFDAATFAAVPKLTDYTWINGGFNTDEVVLGGKIASVELRTHPTRQSIVVHYTRMAEPDRAGAENQLIAAVATEETETAVTEQLARKPKQPAKTRVMVENPCGSVYLRPNDELSLDALVGNVTGEVGLVSGRISFQYGTVDLLLREPIEVAAAGENVTVAGMAKVNGNGNIYAPVNGRTGSPVRSDFRLAINAQHGQVRIAYQPYKAAN